MSQFLAVLVILAGLLAVYAFWGRGWLKSKSWTAGFFALVEPVELALFKKSETILFARLKMVSGVLLMVLTQLGTIDLTPIMPFVPDQYEPYLKVAFNLLPLVLTLIGAMDEKLRNATTKPLEVVAIADKDVTPEVAQAVMEAEVSNAVAVATVKAAN